MKYLIPLFLLMALASCDYGHMYSYELDNNHSDTLVLQYIYQGVQKQDTFAPGTHVEFQMYTKNGGRKSEGDNRNGDQLSLDWVKSNTTTKQLTESYWTFQEDGLTYTYTFVVDSTIVE